jgi:para-nitrobenzyl esterase
MSVQTTSGEVQGFVQDDGTSAFLGVPYAEPPIGPLRFEPPVPAVAKPRDATAYGATSPQSPSDGPLGELYKNLIIPGDDYLNLNVWTPSTTGSVPVMVFIHGGSFVTGSGSVGIYNGTAFARHGVVLVTINYRLGADGFAWFGDGPANLGMLDQIAALEWVRDNIAGFGGDPSNVTVFGESAGAMSIGALLAMPAARGLFHRAILESGAAHHTISRESAILVANRLADILGVERSRAGLASVPVSTLLEGQKKLAAEVSKSPKKKLWADVATNLLPFEPVVDGITLPQNPLDAIQAGSAAGVDILIGNNAEEGMMLFAPGNPNRVPTALLYILAIRVGLPPLLTGRTYKKARRTKRPVDMIVDLVTDWVYRIPAVRIAEAHPGTYMYEFAWRSPAFSGELGAAHAIELPFVFDTITAQDAAMMTGGTAPQSVADEMHGAWIAFATTGDPGWPAYSADNRVVKRFDTPSRMLLNPAPTTREMWAGRR